MSNCCPRLLTPDGPQRWPTWNRYPSDGDFLRAEIAAGRHYLPAGRNVRRAFTIPFDSIKVLIVGQDPYPTPGHPVGLSSASPLMSGRCQSLINIYKELSDDLGVLHRQRRSDPMDATRGHAAQQMLDRSPVVQQPSGQRMGAYHRRGDPRSTPVLTKGQAGLWSRFCGDAMRRRLPLLTNAAIIESPHPSPLSASRGFGSRLFSRPTSMVAMGAQPVDWALRPPHPCLRAAATYGPADTAAVSSNPGPRTASATMTPLL